MCLVASLTTVTLLTFSKSAEVYDKETHCQLIYLSSQLKSHAIREHPKIEGIQVEKEEVKLAQFADDTTPLLKSQKSVKPLLKLLKDFGKISGLEINTEKTEFLWLGDKALSKDKIDGLPDPTPMIKLLGVYISYNTTNMMEKNMEKKLLDLSSTFYMWRTRNLTLEGLILLAKSLGLSKFIHLATVLTIPLIYQKRIETCLYNTCMLS